MTSPYTLLLEAESATLPLTIEEPSRVDQLRAYLAAGWVEATIPSLVPGPNGSRSQPPAAVLAVTPAGRKIAEQARDIRGHRQKLKERTRLMRG